MPAKRRQNQPQPAHSDYDTETPAPDVFTLPLHPVSVTELNDRVLRRHVPDLERIESIAPFTVLYSFVPESQTWEKSGTEGTMHLCKRRNARYSVVILNRKSLNNFIMELHSADDVEITEEYVILQGTKDDGSPQIHGLWVYGEEGAQPSTKDKIGMDIQAAAMKAETAREGETIEEQQFHDFYEQQDDAHDDYQNHSTPQIGQPIDLARLFSKPQIQPEMHVNLSTPPHFHSLHDQPERHIDVATPPQVHNPATSHQVDLLKLFGRSVAR